LSLQQFSVSEHIQEYCRALIIKNDRRDLVRTALAHFENEPNRNYNCTIKGESAEVPFSFFVPGPSGHPDDCYLASGTAKFNMNGNRKPELIELCVNDPVRELGFTVPESMHPWIYWAMNDIPNKVIPEIALAGIEFITKLNEIVIHFETFLQLDRETGAQHIRKYVEGQKGFLPKGTRCYDLALYIDEFLNAARAHLATQGIPMPNISYVGKLNKHLEKQFAVYAPDYYGKQQNLPYKESIQLTKLLSERMYLAGTDIEHVAQPTLINAIPSPENLEALAKAYDINPDTWEWTAFESWLLKSLNAEREACNAGM
jgi:hypothetical protein